ncbi:hypothetical protein J2741_002601 [Methanolinea mesophila]|uniref:SAM-dependent methyltransferase n=1 Tax=Methanolinea mesophila TaxID=547055 RepID=UPI001AE69B02|nr:class I SAM-dependent methyltransferase [Methanolinea mesophila]MBP1930005.1 hypothetical protein [Methanolinea mesophila]
MEFSDLVTITQGSLPLMNPVSPEKVIAVGRAAGLSSSDLVIECGCGNGTLLSLWGEKFGISGTGIEVRRQACEQAEKTIRDKGLADRITIRCDDAATFVPESPADCAVALGASFIWGGFADALDALRGMVHKKGKVVIGDRYWRSDRVPPDFAREWPDVCTGYEQIRLAREAGFDCTYLVRASEEDWDRYETGIWQACAGWIEKNPEHPDREEVLEYLHHIQDEYAGYGQEHIGWIMYLLEPAIEV